MKMKYGESITKNDMDLGWRWFFGALIFASLIITVFAGAFVDEGSARLEEDFITEERQLSLELKELQLQFYEGDTTGEELQEQTDNWHRLNQQRLEKQTERRAFLQKTVPTLFSRELNLSDQPLDTVRAIALPTERELTNAETEYTEIQKIISEAYRQINGEHENGYDAWIAFGNWSEDNQHLVDRSEQLTTEMAAEQWSRLEPMEIKLPSDASPEEKAFADLEERRIERTFELRDEYRDLDPSEFRDVIHNDAELAELMADQEKYYKQLTAAKLRREIGRLKGKVN